MPPSRIDKSALAFGPPAPPVREPVEGKSEAHLARVRRLGCMICGKAAVEAHHIMRLGDGKPRGQRRNLDRWALPLCEIHHDGAHGRGPDPEKVANDETYFARKGHDGVATARFLWAHLKADPDGCADFLQKQRDLARLKVAKTSPDMRIRER